MLFGVAAGMGVIGAQLHTTALLVIALSMAATPFLVRLGDRLSGQLPGPEAEPGGGIETEPHAACDRRGIWPRRARHRRDARGDRASRSWCSSTICAASRRVRASSARCSMATAATHGSCAVSPPIGRPLWSSPSTGRRPRSVWWRPRGLLYPDLAIIARGHDAEVGARLRALGRHDGGAGDPRAQPDHRRGRAARAGHPGRRGGRRGRTGAQLPYPRDPLSTRTQGPLASYTACPYVWASVQLEERG